MAQNSPHRAKKRFGQNFLHDEHIISQIIAVINPKPSQMLVEIGPGQGALTSQLLDKGCPLTAIELDRDLVPLLEKKFADQTNFSIINDDALRFDYSTLMPSSDHSLRVVGNLPYNISTPLIFHLLEYRANIADMHFMLQKEVVDRLAATPGNKHYGRLSIMTQYHCEVDALFDVPPTAFKPEPKVQSAIVRLKPRDKATMACDNIALLKAVTQSAFSQRRKTLRNTLRQYCDANTLETLGIAPSLRAESLSVENFVTIANYVHSHNTTSTER